MTAKQNEFLMEKLLDVCENISENQVKLNEELIIARKDHEYQKENIDKIKENQWTIRDTLSESIGSVKSNIKEMKADLAFIKDKDKFTRKLVIAIGTLTTLLAGFLTVMKVFFSE